MNAAFLKSIQGGRALKSAIKKDYNTSLYDEFVEKHRENGQKYIDKLENHIINNMSFPKNLKDGEKISVNLRDYASQKNKSNFNNKELEFENPTSLNNLKSHIRKKEEEKKAKVFSERVRGFSQRRGKDGSSNRSGNGRGIGRGSGKKTPKKNMSKRSNVSATIPDLVTADGTIVNEDNKQNVLTCYKSTKDYLDTIIEYTGLEPEDLKELAEIFGVESIAFRNSKEKVAMCPLCVATGFLSIETKKANTNIGDVLKQNKEKFDASNIEASGAVKKGGAKNKSGQNKPLTKEEKAQENMMGELFKKLVKVRGAVIGREQEYQAEINNSSRSFGSNNSKSSSKSSSKTGSKTGSKTTGTSRTVTTSGRNSSDSSKTNKPKSNKKNNSGGMASRKLTRK